VKKLFKISISLFFLALLALFTIYISIKSDLPSVASLKDVKWQTPMKIYSADGKLISQFGEKKRIPLTLKQMPQQLIDAILATEDNRFYHHFGLDPIGFGRAVIGKISGQNKGGASTITMQVARNFFLTREVTAIRKIKEIFTAFHIESLLTKDEILALYLNKIELGHRAFGFGAAAQVYYGKDVKELTLAQIAVLAGLPKAPSTMNPISRPKRAKARRAVVLQRMFVSGYINSEQFEQANNAPITASKHGAEIELNAPYIAEMAHQEMLSRYGKEQAYTSGYKVYLTVSSSLQRAAQQAIIENLEQYDQRHGYRGVIKSLRPEAKSNNSKVNSDDENSSATTLIAPLTIDEIKNALKQTSSYQNLIPAVVTTVNEQSVLVAIDVIEHSNEQHPQLVEAQINWSGLSWARAFINDQKQGQAPKLAADILHYGDIIYVQAVPRKNLDKQEENTTAQLTNYRLSQLPQASAALVALSPDNGAIQASVGGFSFKQSQYNRATQAKRQVGSNIKPFIYSAALENGFTLASLINDAPINQWDRSSGIVWRPKNSPPTYIGPIRVRLGLAQSKNVISVRLLRNVGLGKIINHLSLFGFAPDELPRNESLALGSASLTPTEVATGFATFANGGYLIKPYLIDRIEDSFGKIIFQANPAIACDDCDQTALTNKINENHINEPLNNQPLAERAISKQNAFLMTQAMNSVIWGADWQAKHPWQGTGFRARKLGRRDIAGKTGTTNSSKDAWFSGFSRRLVASSWIGFDDHSRDLGKVSYNRNLGKKQVTGTEAGAKSAQPAWITFMKTALANYPVEPFQQPEDIISVRIDKASGKLTTSTNKSSTFEYFVKGTEPTDYVSQDNSEDIFDSSELVQDKKTPEPQAEEDIF
jgi:penicillin-binding protein 1A